MEDGLGDVGAADASPAAATRPRVWRRVPGWLGVGGALLGLASLALPWYVAGGGATYSGFSLMLHDPLPYTATASDSTLGAATCYGALARFSLPLGLLAGVFVASLVGGALLAWRPLRRGVAFTLALALLVASGLALSVLYPWINDLLTPTLVNGPMTCPPPGSLGVANNVSYAGLFIIFFAGVIQTILTRPAAPWLAVIAASLGLSGFLLPWDLSGTPGASRILAAVSCLDDAGEVAPRCIPSASFPAGAPLAVSTGALAQRAIADDLGIYLLQLFMLLVILALALVVARWRTRRWMFALSVVSYGVALVGNPNLLFRGSSQLGATAPLGYGLVGLGFGVLFLCSGAAKWDMLDNTYRLALEKARRGEEVRATVYNSRHRE